MQSKECGRPTQQIVPTQRNIHQPRHKTIDDMTKKILFSIATFLLMLQASAKTAHGENKTQTTPSAVVVIESTKNAHDSSVVVIGDSVASINTSTTKLTFHNDEELPAKLVSDDGIDYILYDGRAYMLNDILPDPDEYILEPESKVEMLADRNQMVPVLAICFIVPCVTLLIALAFLLFFFMRKSRDRNSIIEKAIDANYQLPEAFFSNQQSNSYHDAPAMAADNPRQGGSEQPQHNGNVSRPARDAKAFSSAVTLLAVGFGLILFFAVNDHWNVAMLAGGIPFFLGIGKLIGYYYVPGFTSSNNNQQNRYPQPPYGTNYPPQNRPTCPPPFNPTGNGSRPFNQGN